MKAEANGAGARIPWAHSVGANQIAHGLPGENGTLRSYFAPGNDAHRELVSKPGLTAIVTVDQLPPGCCVWECLRFVAGRVRT
jgi:hypothetical protein